MVEFLTHTLHYLSADNMQVCYYTHHGYTSERGQQKLIVSHKSRDDAFTSK